jgi:hypothetical protein
MSASETFGIFIKISPQSHIRAVLPADRLVLKLLRELAARVDMLEQKRTGLLKNRTTQWKISAQWLVQ